MDYKKKYLKYKLKYLTTKKLHSGGSDIFDNNEDINIKGIIDNNEDIVYNNEGINNKGIIDNNEGIVDNNINEDTSDINIDFLKNYLNKYNEKIIKDLKVPITEEQKVEEEQWFFFQKPYPTVIFTEVDACSTFVIYGKNKEGEEVMTAIHIRPDNNLKKLLKQLLDNFIIITKIYILTNSNNNNVYDLLNRLSQDLKINLNGKIFILNIKTEFIISGMHLSPIGNTIKIKYTDEEIKIIGWTMGKVPTIEKFEKDDDINFSPYVIYPDIDFSYRVFYEILKSCEKISDILELFKNNFCSILSKHKTNKYITYNEELCTKILKLYEQDSIHYDETCEDSISKNVKYMLDQFLTHHPKIGKELKTKIYSILN